MKLFWLIILIILCALASCQKVKSENFVSSQVKPRAGIRLEVAKVSHDVAGQLIRVKPIKSRPADNTLSAGEAMTKASPAVSVGKPSKPTVKGWPDSQVLRSVPAITDGQRSANPAALIISDRFLDAVAMVESSGRATVIGDGGKARGMFQLHRAAWEDAARVDRSLGDYHNGALNPATARRAARVYLTLLSRQLQKAGHPPTASAVYLCYNRGFSGAASISFDVSKAPKHTQRAIKKLEALL